MHTHSHIHACYARAQYQLCCALRRSICKCAAASASDSMRESVVGQSDHTMHDRRRSSPPRIVVIRPTHPPSPFPPPYIAPSYRLVSRLVGTSAYLQCKRCHDRAPAYTVSVLSRTSETTDAFTTPRHHGTTTNRHAASFFACRSVWRAAFVLVGVDDCGEYMRDFRLTVVIVCLCLGVLVKKFVTFGKRRRPRNALLSSSSRKAAFPKTVATCLCRRLSPLSVGRFKFRRKRLRATSKVHERHAPRHAHLPY